ncbi:MAG: outer membrane protein assembly factor BamA, partial [Methyloligellaceae bacterium]
YYLKNGYADVRIVSAVADLDREGKGFFITFTVEEGEPYRFGAINIETALTAVDATLLKPQLLTKEGSIYNAAEIDQSVEKLTLRVAEGGYAFARVRPRANRDAVARTIGITFLIEQGPRVYIERINVIGNIRSQDYVIRREFRIAEGDAYNRLLVSRARKRLVALRFFKKVTIKREPGSAPDRVILNVIVLEQSTGELSFGAGYSTQEGVIGDISISERNLLGRGQFLRLKLSGSLERLQADLSFTEPYFMDRNLAAGFDIFHKEQDLTDEASFKSRKTGGSLRLGFPVSERTRITTSYSFVRDEVFDVETGASAAVVQAAGVSNVSSVGIRLSYDTRNNGRNPTRGVYFVIGQDFAGLGGDVKYYRTSVEGRGYYPITKKLTLVGRAVGGVIEGWGGDDVRLIDLFYKGGETIRGFDRAGIGPRDSVTDDALGGKIFYAGTVEVRFPLPFLSEELGMSAAVFADAGSLYDTDSTGGAIVLDTQSIRASVGASLIWASPVGPLRADFAYVLASEEFDNEELFRFGAATRF